MLLILEENVLGTEMKEYNAQDRDKIRKFGSNKYNAQDRDKIRKFGSFLQLIFRGLFNDTTNMEQVNTLPSFFSLSCSLLALMSKEIMTKPNLASSFICCH